MQAPLSGQYKRRVGISPSAFFGFTVIELAIVIILVGIISTTLYMSWPDQNAQTFRYEAHRLISDVRYVKMLAVLRYEDIQMTVTNEDQYTFTTLDGTPLPTGGDFSSSTTLPSGFTLKDTGLLSTNILIFTPSGKIYRAVDSSSGTPEPSNERTSSMAFFLQGPVQKLSLYVYGKTSMLYPFYS